MIELLYLYLWPVAGATVLSVALSLTGAQLVAREWTIRSLVVAQGSSLGVLLGIALTFFFDTAPAFSIAVIAISGVALGFMTATGVGSSRLLLNRPQHMLSIFVMLSAFASVFTALVPRLESSMTAVYAGDVSTLSNIEARSALIVGLGAVAYLWSNWSRLSQSAFMAVVLKSPEAADRRFAILAMLLISVGVQGFGLIFVLSSLFVPTSLVARTRYRGQSLRGHQLQISGVALFGTLAGFVISLIDSRLPTTAVIVLAHVVISVGVDRFAKPRHFSRAA